MTSRSGTGRFLRFAVVGIVNTIIDFGVLNGLVWFFRSPTGLGLLICNAVAFCCANLNSFFLNKSWTFDDRRRHTLNQYTIFLLVSLVGLALNSLVLWILSGPLAPSALYGSILWLNLAKLVATGANMIWNFLAYRGIVFNDSRDR